MSKRFTDEEVRAVFDEFALGGDVDSGTAAYLILEARAERDEARAEIALLNDHLENWQASGNRMAEQLDTLYSERDAALKQLALSPPTEQFSAAQHKRQQELRQLDARVAENERLRNRIDKWLADYKKGDLVNPVLEETYDEIWELKYAMEEKK